MKISIPEKMSCINIKKFGGPENLMIQTDPVPVPKNNEVLIEVVAAGLNRPDIMQRQGLYPPPPGASPIPGLEVSGRIVKINTSSSKFKIGDKVCALLAGGGYAEYCTAPEEQVLKVPNGLNLEEAGAIPETFFTVWANLFHSQNIIQGKSILIHGGASGIGTTAIQLAKAYGATIYTTAGSEKKCKTLEKIGAKKSINYKVEDFAEIILNITKNKGVDIVLDIIGAEYFDRNLKILSMKGKLIILAFQNGYRKNINLLPILKKHLKVTGSTLRPRTIEEKGILAKEVYKNVWPLIENKLVKPIIYKKFKMQEVQKAHILMEKSEHIGKIILKMKNTNNF